MYKVILFLALFLNLALASDVSIKVNGMVCDFCASTMEKEFSKNSNVKTVDINLKTKIITLDFKKGKNLSDDEIRSIVTNQGYVVVNIER